MVRPPTVAAASPAVTHACRKDTGYQVAGWIQSDQADATRSEITFSPDPPAYTNYVNRDTWLNGTDPLWITCPAPTSLLVIGLGSNHADLFWQANTNNTHYLVR